MIAEHVNNYFEYIYSQNLQLDLDVSVSQIARESVRLSATIERHLLISLLARPRSYHLRV